MGFLVLCRTVPLIPLPYGSVFTPAFICTLFVLLTVQANTAFCSTLGLLCSPLQTRVVSRISAFRVPAHAAIAFGKIHLR